MKTLRNVFMTWLPLAVAITGICGVMYVTVQQNYRESLNDPQIQMSEDAGGILVMGGVPAAVVPRGTMIDIGTSLAPWIAVYDETGQPLESSGVLDGAPPKPPQGVFDAARENAGKDTSVIGQSRISWQSRSGVRNAIVVQHFSGARSGFVVAGRNMREVEDREGQLQILIVFGWLITLMATLVAQVVRAYLRA